MAASIALLLTVIAAKDIMINAVSNTHAPTQMLILLRIDVSLIILITGEFIKRLRLVPILYGVTCLVMQTTLEHDFRVVLATAI
jgi:hypothetical protein